MVSSSLDSYPQSSCHPSFSLLEKSHLTALYVSSDSKITATHKPMPSFVSIEGEAEGKREHDFWQSLILKKNACV